MGIWTGSNGANAEQMAYGVAMQQIQQQGYPESMLPVLIEKIAPSLASQINMLSFGSKLDGKDIMQFDGVRARISLPAKTTSRTSTRMPGR